MEQEIEKALKGIEKAARAGTAVLAKFVGNDLSHTGMTEDPLFHVASIVHNLKLSKADAAVQAKYAGLTEEEIVAKQAEERVAELADLQALTQERLAASYGDSSAVVVTELAEADAEPEGENDDSEKQDQE